MIKIHRSVWALGFVSLFMDASSELIHSLLPIFMLSTLGASMTLIGAVEGIAESSALIVKIFSGAISDYFRKRKLLAVIGYGMAACSKPLFPLANTVGLVLVARFFDRIGKGIRDAPRDAMIGDITLPEVRGASFGLRQSLDTVGAFLGPLLAIGGMLLLANDIRLVLWIAVIPAFISLAIMIFVVKEPEIQDREKIKIKISDIRNVGAAYWQVIAIAGIFTLARFSDMFLILKAQEMGIPITFVPMVMVAMNVVYALAAYPAGVLSDNFNKKIILLIGVIFLIIADIVLGFASNRWMLLLGVIFWGLHMAFTQGLFTTMIANAVTAEIRGTAHGMFYFVCGVTMLFSNIMAGMLWDIYGSSVTFFIGAIFTAVVFIGLNFINAAK